MDKSREISYKSLMKNLTFLILFYSLFVTFLRAEFEVLISKDKVEIFDLKIPKVTSEAQAYRMFLAVFSKYPTFFDQELRAKQSPVDVILNNPAYFRKKLNFWLSEEKQAKIKAGVKPGPFFFQWDFNDHKEFMTYSLMYYAKLIVIKHRTIVGRSTRLEDGNYIDKEMNNVINLVFDLEDASKHSLHDAFLFLSSAITKGVIPGGLIKTVMSYEAAKRTLESELLKSNMLMLIKNLPEYNGILLSFRLMLAESKTRLSLEVNARRMLVSLFGETMFWLPLNTMESFVQKILETPDLLALAKYNLKPVVEDIKNNRWHTLSLADPRVYLLLRMAEQLKNDPMDEVLSAEKLIGLYHRGIYVGQLSTHFEERILNELSKKIQSPELNLIIRSLVNFNFHSLRYKIALLEVHKKISDEQIKKNIEFLLFNLRFQKDVDFLSYLFSIATNEKSDRFVLELIINSGHLTSDDTTKMVLSGIPPLVEYGKKLRRERCSGALSLIVNNTK